MKVVPTYENTTDGGNAVQQQYNGETVWCDNTYTVGNDVPQGGTDTLTWVGTDAAGNTVTMTGSVTIVAAATNYPPDSALSVSKYGIAAPDTGLSTS